MGKNNHFHSRSLPIIGEDGLSKIEESVIAISGLGGVGGGTFLALVRAGVKKFKLAENGIFDPPDMNRQAAAFGFTMGRKKLEVYVEFAKSINPDIELELYPEGISVDNLEKFLKESDAYIGVIDIEKGEDVKKKTPEIIKKYNIPLFTCGTIGFGALMVNFHPKGMMPDEFWAKVAKKSENTSNNILPHWITQFFNKKIIDSINNTFFNKGIAATISIGGLCSNTLLASEVLMWILRDTDIIQRDVIFAPEFVAIDLSIMNLVHANILN